MGQTKGSGNKSDRSRLRPLSERGGSATGSGSSRSGNAGLVCLPSFTVPLKQGPLLKKGLALAIRDGGVYAFGTQVGELSARQFKMITECRDEGFGYRGSVAEKTRDNKKYYYGFFEKYRL